MKPSLLVFAVFSFALRSHISAQPYFFSNYTGDNGLSNNMVRCMVKDKEGFIWIGTDAGLNRFNGYDFTVYKCLASDTTALPSSQVRHLLVDHTGALWISTMNGICRYDKNKNTFQRMCICTRGGREIFNQQSCELFEDSGQNLWAAIGTYNLIRFNKQDNCFDEVFENNPAVKKSGIISITEDPDSGLWMTGNHNLFQYNPTKKSLYCYENKISSTGEPFQAMKVIRDSTDRNYLWIATWGNGLVHFNKRTHEFTCYKFEKNVPKNVGNIIFDAFWFEKNKLWLATNEGIVSFNAEKKTVEGFVRDSISEKPVVNIEALSLYKDDDGIVWIGTVAGLCNIHPLKQNFVDKPLWISPTANRFLYDESNEKIYGLRFYYNRALVIYDTKLNRKTEFKIPKADESGAEPFSLLKDNEGLLWIGTTKGIYRFNEKNKNFSLFDAGKRLGIPERAVYALTALKDSDGNLWFSIYSKGVIKIETGSRKVSAFFHEDADVNSFPLNAIVAMTPGNDHMIYACDEKKGVVKMNCDGKILNWFNAGEKKYEALIGATDIITDADNRVWVTTRANGLVRIDTNLTTTAVVKDDFGNIIDEQQSLVMDGYGKIWLTGSDAIYRFDPASKSFTQLSIREGLPALSISELHKLNNGMIAYRFTKGIFSFDPLKVFKDNSSFAVHLTSLSINGRPPLYNSIIDRMDTIVLSHTENNLAFEFAAIDYVNPSSIMYSYLLEGMGNRWSASSRTRVVNFSMLPPGNYRLHIRAGNRSREKKIFLQIVPAWWQTAWFRILVLFASVAAIIFVVRFFLALRFRQKIVLLERQHEIETIRSRISRDIHDEIGSGLTKIKLMSRNLYKNAGENHGTGDISQKISSASDELIQNLSEIVWTINPANDSFGNVIAFIRNYLLKFFEENPEIKLHLDLPEPSQIQMNRVINPEVKRNLVLILKESVTNIFKHAQATEVFITLHVDASKIELHIRDNGIGTYADRKNEFGNGIKNMSKRAAGIGGQLTVHSPDKEGTTVHLSIPVEGL
jgi:ligand-binding sensor domain-containing protein/two-component sensor histidine kinase